MTYKVSVVICHHRHRLIDKAIDSLLKSKGVELQIIVVTSDETYKDQRIAVINQSGGPAIKRNIGFKFCEHKLIAFFDDDIEVKAWTVYEMAKVLQQDKVGMVFGKLLNMEFTDRFDEAGSFLTSTGFLWSRAESGTLDRGQYEAIEPVLAGKSASCMIRRSVFVEAGQFDPSYEILGEETDLSWRVWLCDYKVLYVPASLTYHAFNTKFKPPEMYTPRRVYYNGCRNYLSMLYTNLGRRNWIFPVCLQLVVWTGAAVGMLLTGKREAGICILKGILYFFKNIRYTWEKRYHVQKKIRKTSDKILMPMILRNPNFSYYWKRFFHYISTGKHG